VRRFFIEDSGLPFPIGISAAESLKASDEANNRESKVLFGSLALGAVYAFLRDNLELLPKMLLGNVRIPGVTFGVYNSPMMLAVGFIIGPVACLVWFLGALVGDFGIVVAGSGLGLFDLTTAQGIKASLGLGLMLGAGLGVVLLQLIGWLRRGATMRPAVPGAAPADQDAKDLEGEGAAPASAVYPPILSAKTLRVAAPLVSAAVAGAAALLLGLGLAPAVLVVLGTWVAVMMASQCVGVSGIDPMEVFGILVLLVVQIVFHDIGPLSLFLAAAVVAVACGLTGDVMNDFKAGAILGTSPRAQWAAQAVGGIVGAVVASAVLLALVGAFGTDSFGVGADGMPREFVAAQASVVASLVDGIPNLTAFFIGLAAAVVLVALRLPIMTLGLGVYLPFYLSLTAAIGGVVKLACDRLMKERRAQADSIGLAAASGLLGGESLCGVVSALIVVVASMVASMAA